MSDGIAVIRVTGSLDESSRDYFFKCLEDLIAEGFTKLVVNCEGLGFISSSGLASLVMTRNNTEEQGGKIYLTELNASLTNVFSVTKLTKLFGIYDTTEEVIEMLT